MSFYNPYKSRPDYSQGLSDLIMQFVQMMMMKKYMDQGEAKTTKQAPTTAPQKSGGNAWGNFYQQNAPGPNSELLEMIKKYLGSGGMSGII